MTRGGAPFGSCLVRGKWRTATWRIRTPARASVMSSAGGEPRPEGAAVAAACAVVDDADTRLARGQLVRDRAGAIGAPVVDDRHLEVVGEARQYLEGGCDEGGDVLLFVQRGEEEREPH